jgi:transposase InsO family protein
MRGCLHPDQHILNATQNSLCRAVNRRRGRSACRASNCRRRARFSRTRSSRDLKALAIQPRRCRSDTIMARILAEKTGSSFAPSHSFRRCTTFWRGTPSWLTFLGHMKDSLWSMDLFRCESATMRTHWVLVVMDQYTRRIIGFGVHAGSVDGVALCRMFNRAIRGQLWMSKYLSSDHDPLYRFHQWQANLRVLELTEIKSIPYVPLSHPFVERLIGTLRREYLDHLLFWTTADLEKKLLDFRAYFNNHRAHTSREGRTPDTPMSQPIANLRSIRWQPHCRSLFQTPMAA